MLGVSGDDVDLPGRQQPDEDRDVECADDSGQTASKMVVVDKRVRLRNEASGPASFIPPRRGSQIL